MGLEGLCVAFYDEPALVEEMFTFITDFSIETLRRGIGAAPVDLVELKEDMAYKHAPMISPGMFRAFMLPHYRRLIGFLKGRGAKLVYVDCDGNPEELIPLWIEAGVDGMSPCEAAAGVDPLDVRRRYPGFAMLGGIDKRALVAGPRATLAEVRAKVPPLVERGGYVPHVDHAVPPDVTLESYCYYRELLARIAEGRPLPPA
jgi:uroporphyrinogen decarboxylase